MGSALQNELQIEGDIAAVVGAGFGDGNQVVEPVAAQQEVTCAGSPGASETEATLARSVTLPAFTEELQTNIVHLTTAEDRRAHANSMSSEELADHVAKSGWGEVLLKLVELKPYIEVLWDRFDGLNDGGTIAGCRTKKQFCEKCLHRSIRAVQHMLYGHGPKRSGGKPGARQPEARQEESAGDGSPSARAEQASDGAVNGEEEAQPVDDGFGPGGDEEEESEASVDAGEPQTPSAAVDAVPDLAPGTLDKLSQQINRLADAVEIGMALVSFFRGIAQSLLERHPHSPSSRIDVHVFRNGESCRSPQSRIRVGDWVEYKGGCDILTKQAGQEKALGQVVGLDKLHQPRLRWHDGRAWTKPYSLRDGHGFLRVLFDHQAEKQFPRHTALTRRRMAGNPGDSPCTLMPTPGRSRRLRSRSIRRWPKIPRR
jgi:hypothetical protein